MTTPLPPYRRVSTVDGWVTLAVQLPDFTEGQLLIHESVLDRAEGERAIRNFVEARASTQDILRGEI